MAGLAAIGWTWAVALLTTREHLTAFYMVLSAAPPLWGFFVLDNASLLVACSAGALLGFLCHRVAQTSGRVFPPPTRWLLAAWIVPLADLLRLAGWEIPHTFIEPILIAGITGAAVRAGFAGWDKRSAVAPSAATREPVAMVGPRCACPTHRDSPKSSRGAQTSEVFETSEVLGCGSAALRLLRLPRLLTCETAWLVAVWVLAVACAIWWYGESQRAYDNYLLGYNDFGHFAWRVANTWEGRGFLMETPGLPAFWDHFNPGLALLAPLWGLWPDARLFFVIQAICLAVPAPLVYAIARRLGGPPMAAAAWAAAYLSYPVVGQLNLSCTYGWHPVSLALPFLFAALAAMLRGWRVAAGAACLLACSFQEDVIAVLACLSLVLALKAWRERSRDRTSDPGAATLANRLPWWGWLAACAVFLAALAAVFELAPFSRYQVGRFNRLGSSFGEVLLSPILRPRVFWGTVMRPQTLYFLLALLAPLGLSELRRGWVVLLATLVPLGVLVAWGHSPATSIAFQYTTVLIPVFFLAAMVGAATPLSCRGRGGAGVAALVACAAASIWFGAMPWSQPTLTDVIYRTYAGDDAKSVLEDRRIGSQGNAVLNKVVEEVGGPQSSVLATGRIASHLLRVRRLDTVAQAGDRWKQFEAEIGPGRSPIELFDFVVLDTAEHFHQSPEQLGFIIEHARRAGYRIVAEERGIIVYARPASASRVRIDYYAGRDCTYAVGSPAFRRFLSGKPPKGGTTNRSPPAGAS